MTNPAFNLAQVAIRPDWYDHLPQVEAAMAECARAAIWATVDGSSPGWAYGTPWL